MPDERAVYPLYPQASPLAQAIAAVEAPSSVATPPAASPTTAGGSSPAIVTTAAAHSRLAHRIVALQPRMPQQGGLRAEASVAQEPPQPLPKPLPPAIAVQDALLLQQLGFDPARIRRGVATQPASPLPAEHRPLLPPPPLNAPLPLATIASLLPPPPVPAMPAPAAAPPQREVVPVPPSQPMQVYEPPIRLVEQTPGFLVGLAISGAIGVGLYIALVS